MKDLTKKQKKMLKRIGAALVLTIALAIIFPESEEFSWVPLLLFMVPYGIIGYDILKKAVKGILKGQVMDENFLMAVATVGAIVLGDYREGVAVMLFYQIGELFQNIAVGKSRKSISSLMDIRPDYANLEQDGEVVQVDPDEVATGTVILIRPGEKIPIDGVVVEGTGTLNTSALTGESLPREVAPGDEVISGCINLSGVLRVQTTKEFGESTVSKILDLVENATSKKAEQEKFITRFAHYYTPAVCIGALALAVIPPILGLLVESVNAPFSVWVYRALTFLVISCPCALVVSIPLGFFAGIGGAGKEGILVKGSTYLEILSKTDVVVFDKTGTLTKGVFEVTEIQPEGISAEELLELAAIAEQDSNHPISLSLKRAYGKATDRSRVESIEEVSGGGIKAVIDGKQILAGNKRLLDNNGIACPSCEKAGTIVYLSSDGQYLGYILISDRPKETSAAAIASLKKAGVKRCVMLTGDNKATAEQIASELGITDVYSELLPGDKVEKVEELLATLPEGRKLAFVGDGINDAPVLSRADIGIAMGALGSDAAIEAADIVLMDDDPAKIAKASAISRKCLRIVYENIYFAIGVKLICLVLGALGLASMWLAIFADVGVMVLAVLNAIRALRA